MIDFILLNIYIGFQSVFFKTETYRYLPYKDSPYTLVYHFLSIEELTFSPTSFPLRMSPKSLKEKIIISCIYLGMSNLSPSFSRFIYINLYVRYASAAISLMDSLIICSYCL